ncbi:MAG: hypothetical protein J2P57_25660, partial [Acidimicrobiaceae bacterium]|nr:hypothetical protein [Acidimicrobiaceae bacterium]
RFEAELLDFVKARHGDLLETIRTTSKLPDEEAIANAINEFKKTFATSTTSTTTTQQAGG